MGLSSLFWERSCYCSDFIMLSLGHFSPLVPGGHMRSGPWAICSQRVRFTLRACNAASPWAKLEACVHFKPSSSVHLPCIAMISHCSAGFRVSLDASEEQARSCAWTFTLEEQGRAGGQFIITSILSAVAEGSMQSFSLLKKSFTSWLLQKRAAVWVVVGSGLLQNELQCSNDAFQSSESSNWSLMQ